MTLAGISLGVGREYFGKKFGKVTVAVEPHFTSQECSSCGKTVKKSLSTRWRSLPEGLTHKCSCGCELQRDTANATLREHNAALNILKKGLGTVGHIETLLNEQNASGETTSLLMDFSPSMKADSLKEESSSL